MESFILQFIDNEINDNDLPFSASKNDDCLGFSRNDHRIRIDFTSYRDEWEPRDHDSFETNQWRVYLPYFSREQGGSMKTHQDFEELRFMPFIKVLSKEASPTSAWRTSPSDVGGGYSSVIRVAIHDGHHDFLNHMPTSGPRTFAIKVLTTKKKEDFENEVRMLRALRGRPHVIDLLATFSHGGRWCLIFPWADGDLLAYWATVPTAPQMSVRLVRWVSEQCLGIVKALDWMHNPENEPNTLDPQTQEQLFARHGDIKPENILWFKNGSSEPNDYASGELAMADFGLSSFNHKNSRSKVSNQNVAHTPAYAPPESVLEGYVIGRAIDIWALGCVFLESVTWLMGGMQSVEDFQRNRYSQDPGVVNDVFWEVRESSDNREEWIATRRQQPRATQYIQDMLDVIQTHMLVPEKNQRITSQGLLRKIKTIDDRCQSHDEYYCVQPRLPAEDQTPPSIKPAVGRLGIKHREYIRELTSASNNTKRLQVFQGDAEGSTRAKTHAC
ncbi:kinase-like domain-containing protein [Lasiosphaeria ovina]|uniref:Kinase-like domain-containing protein n=1 Tax=Lasiosphaeria ovina TaxID=92902 RepID=A0AAE0JXL2_9PEZI|nr:kinase-like domain-containing protein [Lasiosphaeria ovina]